jgi:mannose-1-phosphate guanylyltransferase
VTVALVLAAGAGLRLSPLTSPTFPKQFLPVDQRSLAQVTVERLLDAGAHEVVFATHRDFEAYARHQMRSYGSQVQVFYQERNNLESGGTAAQAAEVLVDRYASSTTLLISGADAVFHPRAALSESIEDACRQVLPNNVVALGVAPLYPGEGAFGYFYRKQDEWHFVQKPDADRLKEIENYPHYWNPLLYATTVQEFYRRLDAGPLSTLEPFDLDSRLFRQAFTVQPTHDGLYWNDIGTFERLRDYLLRRARGDFGDD